MAGHNCARRVLSDRRRAPYLSARRHTGWHPPGAGGAHP